MDKLVKRINKLEELCNHLCMKGNQAPVKNYQYSSKVQVISRDTDECKVVGTAFEVNVITAKISISKEPDRILYLS